MLVRNHRLAISIFVFALPALFVSRSALSQGIPKQELIRYIQPGRWDIEVTPVDPSRLTASERQRLAAHPQDTHLTSHATDCVDPQGNSALLADLEGTSAGGVVRESQRRAARDCKSTLTALGSHEARIVTSCNFNGRITEEVMECHYTSLEVSRKGADGQRFVFKKGHRVGECG